MIHTTSADPSDVLRHGDEELRTVNCKTGLSSLPWANMAIRVVPIYKPWRHFQMKTEQT